MHALPTLFPAPIVFVSDAHTHTVLFYHKVFLALGFSFPFGFFGSISTYLSVRGHSRVG